MCERRERLGPRPEPITFTPRIVLPPELALQLGRVLGAAEVVSEILQTGQLSANELVPVGRAMGDIVRRFLDEAVPETTIEEQVD